LTNPQKYSIIEDNMNKETIQILLPATVAPLIEETGMGFVKFSITESYKVDNEATASCLERVAEFLRASKNTNGEPVT